jgi:uncharacterized membrane-anchored protein YitT (DUF2179 family)
VLLVAFGLFALAGCADPSLIGVQDFGTVYGNAVSSTGQPLSSALISATGTTSTVQSAPNGSFTLTNVAVGEQTISAAAPGYATATADVIVTKDQSVNAGNLILTVQTNTPVNH